MGDRGYWTAARTKNSAERVALENAERQGFLCYLPRYRVPEIRRGQLEHRELILFPNYLLVFITGIWSALAGTKGVADVVRTGEWPSIIRDVEIERIRAREDRDGFVVLDSAPRFQRGEQVIVQDGRFAGLSGIFQESTTHQRCRVLFDMLGAAVPTELSEDDLVSA